MKSGSPQKFSARIWLTEDDIDNIEVWVDELFPTDLDSTQSRSATEWVKESLQETFPREEFIDIINGVCQAPVDPEGCYQIFVKGTLQGHWSYYENEYDEDIDFTEVKWAKLHPSYFGNYELTEVIQSPLRDCPEANVGQDWHLDV